MDDLIRVSMRDRMGGRWVRFDVQEIVIQYSVRVPNLILSPPTKCNIKYRQHKLAQQKRKEKKKRAKIPQRNNFAKNSNLERETHRIHNTKSHAH